MREKVFPIRIVGSMLALATAVSLGLLALLTLAHPFALEPGARLLLTTAFSSAVIMGALGSALTGLAMLRVRVSASG